MTSPALHRFKHSQRGPRYASYACLCEKRPAMSDACSMEIEVRILAASTVSSGAAIHLRFPRKAHGRRGKVSVQVSRQSCEGGEPG